MTDLKREYGTIVRSLSLAFRHRERIHIMMHLGPQRIREFDALMQTQILGPEYQCSGIFYPNTDLLMYAHNTHGPASGSHYYLFDCQIHQRDWFTVLGITRDEQLIHLLKWGIQP